MIYQVRDADTRRVYWITEQALREQGIGNLVPIRTLDLFAFNLAYGGTDATD